MPIKQIKMLAAAILSIVALGAAIAGCQGCALLYTEGEASWEPTHPTPIEVPQ
jgi:hypothetical protein